MTEHNNDFRPLPVGWYTRVILGEDEYALSPCPGLILRDGDWLAAHPTRHKGGVGWIELFLVYRPDLAHLPGDLTTKDVDGVEYVRPEFTAHRRVIGPDTPWPISKMEA